MIQQDRPRQPAADTFPQAHALFARKGEAVPVGGRSAQSRVISMRPFMSEQQAPIVLPMPANTAAADPIDASVLEDSRAAVVGTPTMGPAISAAILHATSRTAPRSNRAAAKRRTVRLAASQPPRRTASKRTMLRLDAPMRARLAQFATSETLSVQTVLSRALERFLPAISIERSAAASLRLRAGTSEAGARRSVRFDPHLYWRLKTAADRRRCSMQSIMIAALEAYLSELEAPARSGSNKTQLSIVA